ncbi:alkaline phosphatase D family protein [Arundinibacter roseus]|uniref:Alkaline phosphatase family protein n=1 Tax=Arundinibacter roseus TaxID=2070510 RepID=A0A4R4KIR8_9BACT|nr:alkaline phosphatase D family protein [Arundinibacter roseus]TDB68137.1 alkaline phosphatase family protein [Arundinibacter roseus]
MKKYIAFAFCFLLSASLFGQIQSGPMVGYSDMREVMLWVQTQQAANVRIDFWEDGKPTARQSTEEIKTEKKDAFVAKLLAYPLEPGKKYSYEVVINNKVVKRPYPLQFQTQALWQYRSDPPNFRFAIGSCTYVNDEAYDRPGKPYGGQYEIFKSIHEQKPDFMIWGGDNTYLREPDWNTRSGMLYRYTHTRSLPEMQALLGSAHNYAIWDDHDFGPNDSDRAFWLKNTAAETFKLFWANPNYVLDGPCTGTFFWNDIQFFLLDDRWFKAPNERAEPRDYFGQQQIRWLIDALSTSKAPFKFVVAGGQIINASPVFENYSNYAAEQEQFLKQLADEKIPGVIFLTGDRHSTALHTLKRPGTYPLHDFTISPLTSGRAIPVKEEYQNSTMDTTTVVTERNFAILDVSGPATDRKLRVSVRNVQGKELWSRELTASELK